MSGSITWTDVFAHLQREHLENETFDDTSDKAKAKGSESFFHKITEESFHAKVAQADQSEWTPEGVLELCGLNSKAAHQRIQSLFGLTGVGHRCQIITAIVQLLTAAKVAPPPCHQQQKWPYGWQELCTARAHRHDHKPKSGHGADHQEHSAQDDVKRSKAKLPPELLSIVNACKKKMFESFDAALPQLHRVGIATKKVMRSSNGVCEYSWVDVCGLWKRSEIGKGERELPSERFHIDEDENDESEGHQHHQAANSRRSESTSFCGSTRQIILRLVEDYDIRLPIVEIMDELIAPSGNPSQHAKQVLTANYVNSDHCKHGKGEGDEDDLNHHPHESNEHLLILNTTAPFLSEFMKKVVPPTGSSSGATPLAASLALAKFLQTSFGATMLANITEPWIVYLNFHQQLIVTIRSRDCIPVARMRENWNLFRGLAYSDIIWQIYTAAVVNFQNALAETLALLDECSELLMPSFVENMLEGKDSDSDEMKHLLLGKSWTLIEYASPLRKKTDSAFVHAIKAPLRFCQRFVRQFSIPGTLQLTSQVVTLLHLVYRQVSVYERTLCRLYSVEALLGDIFVQKWCAKREMKKKLVLTSLMRRVLDDESVSSGDSDSSDCSETPSVKSSPRKKGAGSPNPRSSPLPPILQHLHPSLSKHCMLEARALRLESVEKCDHTKSHITEIMNLSMSLNGDYLTDQLKLLAALKMWFDPVSFVCTHNGMNWIYEMPEIYWSLKYGYLGAWIFIIGWSICVFLYFKWRRL